MGYLSAGADLSGADFDVLKRCKLEKPKLNSTFSANRSFSNTLCVELSFHELYPTIHNKLAFISDLTFCFITFAPLYLSCFVPCRSTMEPFRKGADAEIRKLSRKSKKQFYSAPPQKNKKSETGTLAA